MFLKPKANLWKKLNFIGKNDAQPVENPNITEDRLEDTEIAWKWKMINTDFIK